MARRKIGIWLIGAKGAWPPRHRRPGRSQKRTGRQRRTGHAASPSADLDLARLADFVLGGHEIRQHDALRSSHAAGEQQPRHRPDLVAKCKAELDKIDKNIAPGTLFNVGPTIEEFADRRSDATSRKETPREPPSTGSRRTSRSSSEGQQARSAHRGQRRLDRAAGGRSDAPDDAGPTRQAAGETAEVSARRQFALRHRRAGTRLFRTSTSPLARLALRRPSTSWRSSATPATWGTTARRARRC